MIPSILAPGQEELSMSSTRTAAAMVISLDFELHWGVRDFIRLDAGERRRLLAAREMVVKILEVFREYGVHATWATVGLLFAGSRDEAEAFQPRVLPAYKNSSLNPYLEQLGTSEDNDPFHFAPSLIRQIAATPGQEIASHSFSHYYCLEAGQSAESFEADLEGAVAIAASGGYRLRSYVFPRNQANPAYLPLMTRHGIEMYRGAGTLAPYKAVNFAGQRRLSSRAVRLLDTFFNLYGPQMADWPAPSPLCCLEPSRYLQRCRTFLRPVRPLAVGRIVGQMRASARSGRLFHLWWHPEDFVTGGNANIGVLRQVLDAFSELRAENLMTSLSMAEVASTVLTRSEWKGGRA
jgi:peptidoglycan/xylan/chitin deacetylase (PgdA/CDA1 family)